MDSKLEELMKQKREIERQIKELKKQITTVNRCTFKNIHYSTSRPDEWKVVYKTRSPEYPNEERNISFITHTNRRLAIMQIKEVINDLQELYDELMKEAEPVTKNIDEVIQQTVSFKEKVNSDSERYEYLLSDFILGGGCDSCGSQRCTSALQHASSCSKFRKYCEGLANEND